MNPCTKRGPRDVLHHDEELACVAAADLVNRDDIAVAQMGKALGLPPKAALAAVEGPAMVQLDRHLALERGVHGQVHDPHSAAAEAPQDLEAAELERWVVEQRALDHVERSWGGPDDVFVPAHASA